MRLDRIQGQLGLSSFEFVFLFVFVYVSILALVFHLSLPCLLDDIFCMFNVPKEGRVEYVVNF